MQILVNRPTPRISPERTARVTGKENSRLHLSTTRYPYSQMTQLMPARDEELVSCYELSVRKRVDAKVSSDDQRRETPKSQSRKTHRAMGKCQNTNPKTLLG